MTNTDNTVPGLTGGYVTKADKTTGGDPVAWSMQSYSGTTSYMHDSPKPNEITTQQNNYIRNQFTLLQNAATAQNASITNGYPSIIDVPSFIDYILISELASNADSYQYSTYFHKDRNGKLRAGPIWDFDLTYGNDLFQWGYDRSHTDVWQFDNWDNTGSKFWKDLYNNPTFQCYLTKRWKELTATNRPLNYFVVAEKMEQFSKLTSEAMVRENKRWGTIPNQSGEIAKMKEWIQARINWLNTRLTSYTACSNPVLPELVISKINYNPLPVDKFNSDDLEFLEIKNKSNQTINLTGIYLSELGFTYQFPSNSTLKAHSKLILASNVNSFQQFYGTIPFGQFTRNLSNTSEKIVLADAFGNVINFVEYHDSLPWPVEADSGGYFLHLTDINSDNSLAENWTFSSNLSVGMNDNSLEAGVKLYPNPAQSAITVEGNQHIFNSFEIFDLSGRKMRAQNEINKNRFTIDVEKLLPGIYILKLGSINGENMVLKFSRL